MGGCSAPNCSNSTTIGKQLFRFPKDSVRMRKWLVNCRRDFVPTPCSRLCQDHFEESQFEEIARSPAGGRKLKPNAIPTLFNVPDPPSPVTPQVVLPVKNEPVEKDLNMGDHGYARRQPPVDSEEDGVQRTDEERPCSLCQHYKTKLEQQQQHTVRLQREAEEMKKRLYKLSKIEKGLQLFLFEDQIRALTLAKRSRRAVWSHDTLLTARKIRCAVGVKGYEYLRELGYPLPSYRTLCNRLEPKMMVTTSMQDELAELGLGIITACDSPEGNVTSDERLIGVMT
ncbi:52 kDa repressor of the inhibitor of the protein kinase-like [Sinocyclocheilus rhinocerous]|uniref:52 kDa repressor of the inhibitor of the protein kinase-like n=1 Tax=Sinocyclocheilus rhinocerous TaxID=307959 RepID=UPI0007B89F9C|nr:PREDICTED: 52 kDa repressor of the inhibitor of the protein kinase-like [Sinocyclocheilus rhinocerous]